MIRLSERKRRTDQNWMGLWGWHWRFSKIKPGELVEEIDCEICLMIGGIER